MKKLYIVFFFLFAAVAVTAQHKESQRILDKLIWDDKMLNIMLDMRVDFQSTIGKGDVNDLTFCGQTIKLWFTGEIVSGIRYCLRHRLNKPQFPLREGYSGATDQAWLAFDIGKRWTITAGKQSVRFGTFEYDYNAADIYIPTMCFNDLDAYKTGVNVAYQFAGQILNLQVVNSDAPQFASEKYKNKALSILGLWEGNLFNGVLKTRWGYGAFQHHKGRFYSWVTPGTQLNIKKFTAELDYYYGHRYMDYSTMVNSDEAAYRYVRDQSVSLNLKYDFGKWKPFIKSTWNQRFDKRYDQEVYQIVGIQAVMEFYPFKGIAKDLRFHALYGYGATRFKGPFNSLDNLDEHTLLVGTRWLFKVK